MNALAEVGLLSINAVLRVAVRHESLLARPAFEELADALREFVDFGQMAVVIDEGDERRLYALSRGSGSPPVVSFGGRFRAPRDAAYRATHERREPYYCDDTRQGSDMERATAAAGYLSYVTLPIAAAADAPVVGQLVFAFRDTHGAREAPLPLLTEVAALLGAGFPRAKNLTRDRRLAMILDTSGDAMLAWDGAGRITDANAAASALTGLARDVLIGASIRDMLGELPDPARTQGSVRLELHGRGAIPVIVSATITSVDDDPMVAAHALLRDRSHVAAAEREAALHLARVRQLEQEHRSLLDNAPLVIFRLDPLSGELRYLSRHAERILGVTPDDALRTPGFLRAVHAEPSDAEAYDAAVEGAKRGVVSPPYEARLRWVGAASDQATGRSTAPGPSGIPHREGDDITVRGTVYPLLGECGEVAAIEGVLADVSAERAARTRLVQADRLSTIGTLAAGVAHEINNPAAFILLGLDMMGRLLTGPGVRMDEHTTASQERLLDELRDSIKRIVDIARDLRLFASPPAPESSGALSVVDVNHTVESALSLTRGQILERAQITRDLAEVPPVLMHEGRLGQVIVNLLVNAAQAIPKGHGQDHSVRVATRSDGRTVEIEVCDTGVGIPPRDLGRIWTPFFTTKSPDAGTGLGLSISREIVERAGGHLRADSPPPGSGRGARFVIALPAAGRGEVGTPVSSPLPRTPARRARVLIVEDETALARALAEEIGQVHDVVVAEGGDRALAILRTQRFDAILCDLRMPGVSGEALYATVQEMYPEHARQFIFMTGVGFGADVERFLTSSGRPVLEKPFATARALLEIAKLCSRQAAT